MKLKVSAMFATPICILKLSETDKIEKEMQPAFEHLNENAYQLSDFHQDKNYELSETLLKQIREPLAEFGPLVSTHFEGRIVDFWCQEYKAGHSHQSHMHSGCVVSCVYYVKCEDASKIVFQNPNMAQGLLHNGLCTEKIKPKTGNFIMFPSWLLHHVEEVEHEHAVRKIAAFNLW